MKTLTINEELKLLLPPLSSDEYAGLERSILKDGVITPLVVWNDILVDGHHRYEICNKHQIPYAIKNVTLDSLEDAKLWAWQHQENRRNLTPYHRAELALRFKDAYAAKAKERQLGGLKQNVDPENTVTQNFAERSETRKELAEIAGVSHTTLGKVEYIVEHADEGTKDNLRKGKKGCSIHKEYSRLKSEQEPPEETCTKKVEEEEDIVSALLNHYKPGRLDDHEYGPKTQLRPIPRDRPDVLIGNLIAFFPKEFVPNAAREIFRMLHDRYGKDVTQPLVLELYKMYGK